MTINDDNRSAIYLKKSSTPRWQEAKVLAVFSIVIMTVSLGFAHLKPLWFDELITLYIARLPSLGDVWSALSHGPDANPPLQVIAVRWSTRLFGESHSAIRLPSAFGFLLSCLCLYKFTARRLATRYAWCAALLLIAGASFPFSYEARPYGLWLGWGGLLLLCWQAATEDGRLLSLAGMALALAAGISTHWYFVLLLVPLVMGEAIRSWSIRRIEWPIWLALILGLSPLVFYGPLLENGRSYSGNFWAKPTWSAMVFTYVKFSVKLMPIFIFVAVVALVISFRRTRYIDSFDEKSRPFIPLHEIMTGVGLIATPVMVLVLAKLMRGGYVDRYAISFFIGVSILVAFSLATLDRRLRTHHLLLPLVFVVCAVLMQGVVTPLFRSDTFSWPVARIERPRFLDASRIDLPFVISDSETFLQHAHYSTRGSNGNYSYIIHDNPNEDTTPKVMSRLRNYCSYEITSYKDFLSKHNEFYLLVEKYDDLKQKLVLDGHDLRQDWTIHGQTRFLVTVNRVAPRKASKVVESLDEPH